MLLERLDTTALRQAYAEAVLPPDLPESYRAMARGRADEFASVVLTHVFGDDAALSTVEAMVHAGAADSLQAGERPGPILDRLDAGRRVILRAVDALAPPAGTISALDDRFSAVQSAGRRAIDQAVSEHAGVIETAVAGVVGDTQVGLRPEQVMLATAHAFAALVGADTAHLWLEVGGGLVELVASIGTTAISQSLFVSSDSGAIAEVMRGGPERRYPLKGGVSFQAWRELLPELEPSAAALVVPLLLGGQPLGVLIGLRQRHEPFEAFQERDGVRFARRVAPTVAWSLQARVAHRVSVATQDFLRVTTHELRRPLTVLRGYVDMLRGAHPDEVPAYRDHIDRAAERFAELLSELTEMVILEDPLRPLGVAEHTIGSVVHRAAQAASDEATQQACTLIVEVDQPGTTVYCDTHHVEHAIANLLSNAFRHTGGQRCVWLRAGPRGDRSWETAVRDEGVGFARGDADLLFEKYYRSEATRSSGAAGSGLGLHYVRLVAERHGGRVVADGGDGGGAEFTLILPRVPGMMPWPG